MDLPLVNVTSAQRSASPLGPDHQGWLGTLQQFGHVNVVTAGTTRKRGGTFARQTDRAPLFEEREPARRGSFGSAARPQVTCAVPHEPGGSACCYWNGY